MRKPTPAQVGAREGFRSGLEVKVAGELRSSGTTVAYELHKLSYVKPARPSKYTPDFILDNAIVIETKGRFITEDRHKHILIKAQWPGLDLRFVFSSPNTRISKTSKTTYAMWCETHGFPYASKSVPPAWIDEEPTTGRVEATKAALGWTPPSYNTKD